MSKRLDLEFIDVSGIQGDLEDVFQTLSSLSVRGKVLVSYAFGRQVNEWLTPVWPKCLERLARVGQTLWAGDAGNYYLRYVPNRYFDIGIQGGGKRVKVYDLKPWFGDRAKKDAFDDTGTKDLSELGDWLCQFLTSIDARPSHGWHGPGASAATLIRRNSVLGHLPAEDLALYSQAYYGGRIQAVRVGDVGQATRYDLRSAYASALVDLPSLHGRWEPVSDWREASKDWSNCLLRVEWSTPAGYSLTPFPWRGEDGHVSYPPHGQGWYWGSLVSAAMGGPWELALLEGWRFVPDDPEVRPFAYLRDLHGLRTSIDSPVCKDIIKAILVSTYGKLIQPGSNARSMIWAGMVTAAVQGKLLSAAIQTPDSVASFLTDGLFVAGDRHLDLLVGDDLGCWSREVVDGLWVFQPAFYVTSRKEPTGLSGPDNIYYDLHASGMADQYMLARRAVGAWMINGMEGRVRFVNRAYCGIAMALQRGWTEWNSWVDLGGEMRLHPTQGFPGPRTEDDASVYWEAWNPGEDYSKMPSPYVPRGRGLVDERWEEVEEIRAREECLG